MLSSIWSKIVAAGVIVGAVLALVAKVFSAGKQAGQDEVIREVDRAKDDQRSKVDQARREGEIREREVEHEEKPADYDRYR